MKLNIVTPRTGWVWVKLGFRTFFQQPLAMSGLFFMFMALLALASMLPFIGAALALALLPAATLGLMAATQEASKGKFPMPLILISAFRAGKQRFKSMAVLGAIYAAGFLAIIAVTSLIDGGQFARLYLVGGKITEDLVRQPDFQAAMWATVALYLPLSLTFWHAPALVHWQNMPPVKSLFFSFMACYKNFGALTLFGAAWVGIFMATVLALTLVSALLGSPALANLALFPISLIFLAVFFTSIFFTYQDSFEAPSDAETTSGPL